MMENREENGFANSFKASKKVKSQEHFFQSGLHSKKISLSLDGWSQELYQGTIRNSSLDVRLKGLPFTFPCAEIR